MYKLLEFNEKDTDNFVFHGKSPWLKDLLNILSKKQLQKLRKSLDDLSFENSINTWVLGNQVTHAILDALFFPLKDVDIDHILKIAEQLGQTKFQGLQKLPDSKNHCFKKAKTEADVIKDLTHFNNSTTLYKMIDNTFKVKEAPLTDFSAKEKVATLSCHMELEDKNLPIDVLKTGAKLLKNLDKTELNNIGLSLSDKVYYQAKSPNFITAPHQDTHKNPHIIVSMQVSGVARWRAYPPIVGHLLTALGLDSNFTDKYRTLKERVKQKNLYKEVTVNKGETLIIFPDCAHEVKSTRTPGTNEMIVAVASEFIINKYNNYYNMTEKDLNELKKTVSAKCKLQNEITSLLNNDYIFRRIVETCYSLYSDPERNRCEEQLSKGNVKHVIDGSLTYFLKQGSNSVQSTIKKKKTDVSKVDEDEDPFKPFRQLAKKRFKTSISKTKKKRKTYTSS